VKRHDGSFAAFAINASSSLAAAWRPSPAVDRQSVGASRRRSALGGVRINGRGGSRCSAPPFDVVLPIGGGRAKPLPNYFVTVAETAPAEEFPVAALGPMLVNAARAIHDRVQAPLAICAQSVMAAATLAVQGHAERRKATTRPAGPSTGTRNLCARSNDAEQPAYINDKAAWDRAREVATKNGKGNRAAIKTALDRIGPEPAAPLDPMLTCPEPTFEGLCKLLAIGQPSLGIFSSEGGQFIGGHGMNDENKLKTV
jgi:hypothetical protein